jgi:hypothetical protein
VVLYNAIQGVCCDKELKGFNLFIDEIFLELMNKKGCG